jgi:hypothetical protein
MRREAQIRFQPGRLDPGIDTPSFSAVSASGSNSDINFPRTVSQRRIHNGVESVKPFRLLPKIACDKPYS